MQHILECEIFCHDHRTYVSDWNFEFVWKIHKVVCYKFINSKQLKRTTHMIKSPVSIIHSNEASEKLLRVLFCDCEL